MAKNLAPTARTAETTAVGGTRDTRTRDRGAHTVVVTVAAHPRKLTRADFVLVN
ncbi:hypothetical protein [Streptomyces sp. T028]|uniref:hypothetical protein n=1 Tax=Streptomyces sp. T028 TaxID=3394379 RepID=UPI003A864310